MNSARWQCFSLATQRHRSPAQHCPSMAAGPPIDFQADQRGPRLPMGKDAPLDVQRMGRANMPKRSVKDSIDEFRQRTNGQVALVLQGGGALGAYQVGVYQALHEAGVEPDWLIGTSIGAINAGIIAGNKPEDRLSKLQEFWRRVERSTFWGAFPAWTVVADALSTWTTL